MRRMAIGWGASLLVVFAACANDDEPTFENGVIFDESAVPEVLSEAQCEAQLGCDCLTLAAPVGEDPTEHTMARCIEHRRLELEFWQQGAQFYGLTYDAACMARRLEQMEDVGCGDQAVWSGIQADGSCADRCRIYHGDLADGDDCDLEDGIDRCGQGLYCDWSWDETVQDYTGSCKAACVPDGESCLFASCAPGSQCIDWACQPAPRVGDPCPEYWCLGGFCNQQSFVCEPYLAPGDDCTGNPGACSWGCANGLCQEGTAYVCGWDFRQPYGQYY